MTRKRIQAVGIVCLGLAATNLAISAPPPVAVDPRFSAIEQIAVLPVADLRTTNREIKVDFRAIREGAVKSVTKGHRFRAVRSDVVGADEKIDLASVNAAGADWIRELGPADARWVLLLGLTEISATGRGDSKRYTTGATVMGLLCDKQAGTVLWRGTGSGVPSQYQPPRSSQYGGLQQAATDSTAQLADVLTKIAFPGLTKSEVLSSAVWNLLNGPAGLPVMPKGKK